MGKILYSPETVVGRVFGRLRVETFIGGIPPMIEALCSCGLRIKIRLYRVTNTRGTASCGCLRREITGNLKKTHGRRWTPIYRRWINMRRRCSNPKSLDYANYGGRGIRVCGEWEGSFPVFASWADTSGFRDDLEIDRIDNDGNYEPGNCRWVPHIKNTNNTRRNINLVAFGEAKSISMWARDPRCKVHRGTLRDRIVLLGWEDRERAITEPATYSNTNRTST